MTGSSSARDAGSMITAIWLPLIEVRCETCGTSQRPGAAGGQPRHVVAVRDIAQGLRYCEEDDRQWA
jgi:hypothetical protein